MIFASASLSTVEWDPKKCLLSVSQSPEGVLVASHLSRRVSKINPGAFQVTSSALGLGVYELCHMSLKRRVSISYTAPALLKISPAGFQSLMFWDFIFLGTKPWVGEPKVRLRLLLLRECCFSYPPSLCFLPYIFSYRRSFLLALWLFSWKAALWGVVILVCPRKVIQGIPTLPSWFLPSHTILKHNLFKIVFYIYPRNNI